MADIDQIIAGGAGAGTTADFSKLPGILDAFYKGRDEFAKNDLRTAFQNGVPTTADGQPDFGAMAKTLFQKGALEQGTAAANLGLQQQNLQQNREGANFVATGGDGPPQQPPVGPSTSRNTVTIDPSKRADISSQPQQQQQQQPTIMTVLAAQGIPNDQLGAASASVARQIGVNPTDPLNIQDPQVRNVLAPAIAQLKRVGQVQPQQQPGSSAPMVPTPVATQAIQPQQQPQPAPQPQAASPFADAQAAGLIPSGVDPNRYVAGLKFRAAALPKGPAQASIQAQIDAINKASVAGIEPTNEMKNAASMGQTVSDFQRSQEETKQDVTRFAKQAEGIDSAAAAATSMIPHLQLARSLMNQPGFYSGTGEGINLAYKRAIAAFGGDPNASLPQEGFRKVMAANILDQVAQLKAETAASGGSTRIFQSQIQLMEKAAQNPDNSIAANRLLTEMGFRAAQRAQQIANMADNYNGGHLNPQFNVMLRKWNADHPMFTPAEMADPRVIAAPEFQTAKSAFDAKLPKGTPVKISGQIKWVR